MQRVEDLATVLSPMLGALPPVILCIGSDRVTGDCLGPIVGQMLLANSSAIVYGNLTNPVTALNLADAIKVIKLRHPDRHVIAVDSSVGDKCDVGKVKITRGCIRPGAADGKNLPEVGDVSITATVAADNHKNLYSVRLGKVFELATLISNAIAKALENQVA